MRALEREPSVVMTRDARRGPMHRRLYEATAALHARVEAQLDLLSPALTAARYCATLQTFYGYYEPLEQRMAAPSAGAPVAPRHRAPLLARDLRELGLSDAQLACLARCPFVPELETSASLAGCLYVLEGAALGGQLISRAIARHLGIVAEHGGAFFRVGTEDARTRFEQVLRWLETLGSEEACAALMIEGARETFASLSRWIDGQESRA